MNWQSFAGFVPAWQPSIASYAASGPKPDPAVIQLSSHQPWNVHENVIRVPAFHEKSSSRTQISENHQGINHWSISSLCLITAFVSLLEKKWKKPGKNLEKNMGKMGESRGTLRRPASGPSSIIPMWWATWSTPEPLVLSWWKLKRSNQQKLKHSQCVYHVYIYIYTHYIVILYVYIYKYYIYNIIIIVNNISKPSKPPWHSQCPLG